MPVIERQHHHFFFDRHQPPVVTVNPGELATFHTLDACRGLVRSVEDYLAYRKAPPPPGDPVTGPVYVRGARPGGTLVAEIVSVKLEPRGFQLIGPNRGLVGDEVPEWDCYPVRIEGDEIVLRHLRLPVASVIGALGNAPAGAPYNRAGPLGGNLDVPQVCVGARVHIPIEVEGALFSLGDVHARQGDGEVVGAPEIAAAVTVRFDVLKHRRADWLMVEHDEHWYVVTTAATELEAIRLGVFEAARFVQHAASVSFNDAMVLLTMTVSLHTSRTGRWGDGRPVMCTGFPKSLLNR